MSHPDLSSYEVDDTWATSESVLDEMPMIVRIRQNLRQLAGHPELPNRLRVVWEYELENDSGLPSTAEMQRMEICEDALVDAFERDNLAILTHVLTCDGLRQWIFYASDVQECANRLNDALPHDPPMPIELTVDPDEPWSEYTETLGTLGL
jgi:hypothetical protein